MQRTILQVPVTTDLKENAEKAALQYGFTSLQKIIKLFMEKLADRKVDVYSLEKQEEVIYLSKKNAKRYAKMVRDMESGKEKVYTAKNVDEFIEQLTHS